MLVLLAFYYPCNERSEVQHNQVPWNSTSCTLEQTTAIEVLIIFFV